MRKWLQENGGIPKGKLEAKSRSSWTTEGASRRTRIIRSSGNQAVDEAVKKSLKYTRISEPLRRTSPGRNGTTIMNIKITSQG